MTPALAAASGLLAFAAAWELAGFGLPPALARPLRAVRTRLEAGGQAASLTRPSIERRLRRAGLAGRVGPRSFVAARGLGALAGACCAIAVLPVTPGRLVPVAVAGLVGGGLMAPDALAERAARRRSAAIVAALPDALDLLAVGAGAGREPAAMLGDVGRDSSGPLAAELAAVGADLETGVSAADALRALHGRLEIPELGLLAATLERSRRYGSPLADQLHARAAAVRADERRRIGERAARAGPKIQLVVALLLVPSSLLAIAAALVAHSGALFAAL